MTPTVPTPTSSTSTTAVTGRIQNSTDSLSGYRVVFNLGRSRLTGALTDAQGRYTLSMPVSTITGNDTLSVLDPSGGLVAVVPVTLTPGAAIPPITVGPPTPPGSV